MKNFTLLLIGLILSNNVFGKKINVTFVNKSQQNIQLFYQLIDGIEKAEPKFVFNLDISTPRSYTLKLKKNQKVKFIGYGSGVETLPVIREKKDFNLDINEIELTLPKLEKLKIMELNAVMAKLENNKVLGVLLDSSKYVKDKMPPVGTFIFYNAKKKTTLPLNPSFWKNREDLRVFDKKYYSIVDHVSSTNSAKLGLAGVPFLMKLGASFQKSNLLEIKWEVKNAHFEQWQPGEQNVFQIIEDVRNQGFINSCVTEMNADSLAGGDYKLYFISSMYVVDKIKIDAKKYNKVNINADANFSEPITSSVEVVKPIEVNVSYGYLKEKLYHNVDSSLDVSLKVLALDYTSALNTHLSSIAKREKKLSAERNASRLKTEIINQYKTLNLIDSDLISSEDVEVIIPILEITPVKIKEPIQFDSLENDITPESVKSRNVKVTQFNSILKVCKDKITKYKETLVSIENLSQPTDYYKIVQSINPTILDNEILDSYVRVSSE